MKVIVPVFVLLLTCFSAEQHKEVVYKVHLKKAKLELKSAPSQESVHKTALK